MSIKKSQAILKRSIDLKFSVWFTLGSENDDLQFVTIRTFFSFLFLFPLSSFLFPLSSFLFPLSSCRSFSVLKILTVSRPEKSSKCHKTWFRFLSP